ncbi:MAG: glucose-6-phosphate dehydrogenase, partial [bacterium]|nr:glucose-6-phosphate dehydrogenase [bacterium]
MIKQLSKLEPTVLTIFGATGDLSANYLLPALLRMAEGKLLPQNFRLVAVGRRDFDTAGYLDFISKKSRHLKSLSRENRKKIFKNLVYYRGDLDDPSSFSGLADLLQDPKSSNHTCFNRLYYFATAPEFFPKITSILHNAGLLKACANHSRQVRVLIEKPFGSDLKTAKVLNRMLLKFFSEEQIYRIDHYQGKETVQNLMVVRFANSLFEPLWNKNFISHIEVSALYDGKVGERAYFDQAGILRDVVQNHTLQMLAMILMDEPRELLTKYICDEKVKILEALRPFKKSGV